MSGDSCRNNNYGGRGRARTRRRRGHRPGNGTRKKRSTSTSGAFVRQRCSPENTDAVQNKYTCYSRDDLSTMRDLWNARHPDAPMDMDKARDIWTFLKTKFRKKCRKESCWIRQLQPNKRVFRELGDAFAPHSPDEWRKNPNEWLSSVDIEKVMWQYEKKYKCFEFLGPSPIDFDTRRRGGSGTCIWDELCHFRLSEMLARGKTKIGIIFNLDPHYKGGSHWVSMFISIPKRTIFYFDSAGDAIPPQIAAFAERVTEQGLQLSPRIHFRFDQNHPTEHQYGNTECGVYSLFFIVHMLEDKITGHYMKTHVLRDKYMQKFRGIYFNG